MTNDTNRQTQRLNDLYDPTLSDKRDLPETIEETKLYQALAEGDHGA